MPLQYEQQHAPVDKQAANELDFLAHLVHVAKPAAGDNFKLNLFLDSDAFDDEGQKPASSSKPSKQQHHELEFGSSERNDTYIKASRLGDVLGQVQLEDTEAGSKGIGDELLDLMDSVA